MQNRSTAFAAHLREFIRRTTPDPTTSDAISPDGSSHGFDALALELFRIQFAANAPFRALCQARGVSPDDVVDWRGIPAVPTDAFKEADLSCLAPDRRTAVFHSSGTTQQRPSRHFHGVESLALYEDSLKPWFHRHLLGKDAPGGIAAGLRFVSLTPPAAAVPRSSLVHMLDVVARGSGDDDPLFAGRIDADGSWSIDADVVLEALASAETTGRPVLLLGTAFNFVHLVDLLSARGIRRRLPEGSRVMETGGYKGRSREIPKDELHALITAGLGLPSGRIVTEYGMSELSSQAYEAWDGERGARSFAFPPWARAVVVSPETGREVEEGGTGLLRIVDLANAWSVMAVQTGDLAVRRGAGFALLGRAAAMEPRGCSLMAA